ncbi:MAG: hypothetical protein ACYT04_14250 [Nostoc sp.]
MLNPYSIVYLRLKDNWTYAKVHAVGAIHELPLPENKGFGYCLRKSWIIKKSLKQPIFVKAHYDEFVQCVSPNIFGLQQLH